MIADYEINPDTMALLPHFDAYGNLHTIVIEEVDAFLVPLSPLKLVDGSCRYYGSSFAGRLEGIKQVMGITKKAPIAVSVEPAIFFFPHESPYNHSCAWLSHTHIRALKKRDKRKTIVLFTNGKTVTIPASKAQLEVNMLRTAQYRHLLKQRTVNKRKTRTYYVPKSKHEFIHDNERKTYVIREK